MTAFFIEICDHCDLPLRGVPMTAYRVDDGPTLHICKSCEEKPFKRVEPSARAVSVFQTVRLALGV